MQCANCTFENMPGMKACVRCGSTLTVDELLLEPPRASCGRVGTRVRRLLNPLRTTLAHRLPLNSPLQWLLPGRVSWVAFVLTIIPGLGHLQMRRRTLGWSLLGAWLASLAASVLTLGTDWHGPLWYMTIAAHCLAFSLLFAGSLAASGIFTRLLFGALTFAALALLVYGPITAVASSFYKFMSVPRVCANAVVSESDVIVYEGPRLRPESFSRGDLVVYRMERVMGDGYYIAGGFNLDRIVGVPGDHVRVVGGEVFVNGRSLDAGSRPLAACRLETFDDVIQPGHYIIVPSVLDLRAPGIGPKGRRVAQYLLSTVSNVKHENILGRIVYRVRPWSHFGEME